MDFAHGGELGVTLPDKVLELDGNPVFEKADRTSQGFRRALQS